MDLAAPGPVLNLQPALQARRTTREDEVEDLVALLLAHADRSAGTLAQLETVALTVAVASLGDRHLWQDLGLASRAELSALMRHWFPILVLKNAGDMKWKRFLYRLLCEQAEILICKSPTCADCADQPACFGPED
jgi:nitrogen fixation protein NifQ